MSAEIKINGQEYVAPKKGETLHVTNTGNKGRVSVSISNMDGGSVHISGGQLENSSNSSEFALPPDILLPPRVTVRDIRNICRSLPTISRVRMWKKATLEEDLADIYPGLSVDTVKKMYTYNQEQNRWPDWDELPD